MNVSEIIKLLEQNKIQANTIGNSNVSIEQCAGLSYAKSKHLSFFNDTKRLKELQKTNAGIVVLHKDFQGETKATKVCVEDPYVAYAIIAQVLNPIVVTSGKASSAVVSSSATVPKSCQIGENVVIESAVTLGENCIICAGTVIKESCKLGNGVHISSNVTIEKDCHIGNDSSIEAGTVIGGQGFGFANNNGQWLRIPQIGCVIVGDNVWIGNNCAIDRGTLNDTVIADNCIIDNLVHIAHNVEIGYGSAIAGQSGFAGSTKIGKYNIFGGHSAVTDHIETADSCQFGGMAVVTHSVNQSGSYSGFSALDTATWQKNTVRIRTLDKTVKKIKELEKQIRELK